MLEQKHAPWLWLLTGLFALRIVAQPAALVVDHDLLPPFDSWHGGVLPYPALLLSQLVILTWLASTARRFAAGNVVPHRRIGRVAVVFGGVYFAVMFVRLLLGVTMLSDLRWFASLLPAIFHLVLATYLLLYGHYHVAGRPASASTRQPPPDRLEESGSVQGARS